MGVLNRQPIFTSLCSWNDQRIPVIYKNLIVVLQDVFDDC